MADNDEHKEWQRWWDARVAAMESVLGKSDNTVRHGSRGTMRPAN